MTDIVERLLRNSPDISRPIVASIMRDAATEIASLRVERDALQHDASLQMTIANEHVNECAALQAKLDKAVANNDVALATAYEWGYQAGEEAGMKLQRERDAVIAERFVFCGHIAQAIRTQP